MDGHPMYPCAKLKLDQLFLQWLSLPESQTLVSLLTCSAVASAAMPGSQMHCSDLLQHPSNAAALSTADCGHCLSAVQRMQGWFCWSPQSLTHVYWCPVLQVSNLVEDAQAGKALKGVNSSSATTPLSPTTAHAIFAATVSAAHPHCTAGMQSVHLLEGPPGRGTHPYVTAVLQLLSANSC